jgi:hypothetical protein
MKANIKIFIIITRGSVEPNRDDNCNEGNIITITRHKTIVSISDY